MRKTKKVGSFLLSLCLAGQVLAAAGPAAVVHAETYTSDAGRGFNVPATWEEGDGRITLPKAPDGWDIELFGSDRKQVVDLDGTVTRPLKDVTVSLLYKLKNKTTGEVIETNVNTTVEIPAAPMEEYAAGSNGQPEVIPSLREWLGGSGNVALNQESRILVDSENYVEADASHQKANIQKTQNFYSQVQSFREDLKDITGLELPIVQDAAPGEGDIYFTAKEAPETLGGEGYILEIGGSDGRQGYTVVRAVHKTGVLYGGITILQILKQTGNTLPRGITRDYPQFEKRGYMLDVARTFLPLDYLEDTMKQMAWYKMNTFALHLSDNDIWGNLTLGEDIYAAYRLESDVEGLTAKDGYYTKDEFRELQYDGMDLGVNVIPELDTPGHALAYSRVWPDLARNDSGINKGKYLDVTNPQTIERVKALFDEYIVAEEGKEEVFVGPEVNIGTDEYKNGDKEAFRSYVDGLLKHVAGRGKRPAFWGSLLENSGSTQVMTDALMFAWFQGYADPKKSLDDGYEVLSMEDSEVYIVPGGGYYSNQYGQAQYLYDSWLPNDNAGWQSRSEGKRSPAPLGHPRAVGGQFAVWNDWVGNGISTGDISFRIQYNLMSIAQKCWSVGESGKNYSQFKALGVTLGDAPNCDFLYTNQGFEGDKVADLESFEDISSSGEVSMNAVNVASNSAGRFGGGIQFNGGKSYIETDVTSTGFDWTVGMWINPDEGNGEDVVLMEGKTGTLKLKQGSTGKLGYSVDKLFDSEGNATVDKFNHYFDYTVPEGQWTHIALSGDAYGVRLYANGVFIDELKDKEWPNYNPHSGQNSINGIPPYYETLMLPTATIGSRTNAFAGVVDDLKIYDRVLSQAEIAGMASIPIKARENLALGKNVTSSGNESDNKWHEYEVVDGVKTGDSRWSSNYSDSAWLTVDLGETKTISEINIYWEAAYAKKYTMMVSEDKVNWKEVFNEENGEGGSPQVISFDPVNARYVKFQGVERTEIIGFKWGYSMYEIEVYEEDQRIALAKKINEQNAALAGGLFADEPEKKYAFRQELSQAIDMLCDPEASKDDMLAKEQGLERLEEELSQSFIIVFEGNGGAAEESYRKLKGQGVVGTLPNASREGYTFLGWYTSPEGGDKVDAGTVVNGDSVFYAQWKENEGPDYTITFHGNGGRAEEEDRTVKEGSAVGALPNVFREGYTFLGWYTSPEGGEKVEASYIVTGNTAFYAQWKENAVPKPDPKISFGQKEYTLYATGTVQTSVTANAEAGAVNGYRSDNDAVAVVSSGGRITGVKAGTANITVTTAAGASATVRVTVKTPKVTLTARKAPLQKGKSTKAIAVKSKLGTDRVIGYASSKPSVASVSKKGVIKGRKPGKAKITIIMKSGARATCTITVQKKAVRTKSIQVPKKINLEVKQKQTLRPVRKPVTATDKITYRSSDKKVAAVSKRGVITAKKKGRCTIRVTCNKKTKRITIKVK